MWKVTLSIFVQANVFQKLISINTVLQNNYPTKKYVFRLTRRNGFDTDSCKIEAIYMIHVAMESFPSLTV